MSARALRLVAGRPYVRVWGIRFSGYVVMLYLGCVAGLYVGAAYAAADGLDPVRFALAGIVLLVPALAGARLWFVIQHLAWYRSSRGGIWRRNQGGAALYGGLVLSVAVSVPVLAIAEVPFWRFWDAASITMLVGLVPARVGCLMHGCCAGRETTGLLGVQLPDHRGVSRRRYPTPLLEAAWVLVVLVATLYLLPAPAVPGARFAEVVAAYAAGRLALEWTREGARQRRALMTNYAISAALLAGGAVLLVSSLRP